MTQKEYTFNLMLDTDMILYTAVLHKVRPYSGWILDSFFTCES